MSLARQRPASSDRPRRRRAVVAAIFGLALALGAIDAAAAPRPDEANLAQRFHAQRIYAQGTKLFRAHQWTEAAAAFRESLSTVASPNTRLMLARTLRESGDVVAAFDEYEALVDEANEIARRSPRYAKTAGVALAERDDARRAVALVRVEVVGEREGAVVEVAGAPVAHERLGRPVAVRPGVVEVVLRGEGLVESRTSLDLTAGGAGEVELTARRVAPAAIAVVPEPPPTSPAPAPAPARTTAPPLVVVDAAPASPPSAYRTAAYVAAGVGAASLVTGVVFGALDRARYDALVDRCPNGACPPGSAPDVDGGRAYQTVANVGLGLGVAGLGAAAALYLFAPGVAPTHRGARVDVALGPGSIVVAGELR